MSLNERFTILLKNTGPRPANIRPSGWQKPPDARDLRRRARQFAYRPRGQEAWQLGKTQAQRRAPLGSPEGALSGEAAIGGGPDLLFIHRDPPLVEEGEAASPRTVLKGGMSPRDQDPLPAGLALAPQRNFRRGALPARGGPHRGGLARGAEGRLRSPTQGLGIKTTHQRARFGARRRGRGRGQGQGHGRSPLIRPLLTKEQLDDELEAYMALPRAKERLDAELEAYMAQPVPDEGLDAHLDADMAQKVPDQVLDPDLDAHMADADPDEVLDADLDAYMADADPDASTNTAP